MGGGLPRSWSVVAVLMVLGACSNIIGISSYDIDPELDEDVRGPSQGRGGEVSSGGQTSVVEGGARPDDDDDQTDTDLGGSSAGGRAMTGGDAAGASGMATGPMGGEGFGGGSAASGCSSASECDDTIDCTVDACGADGVCTHAPNDTACSPLTGNCAACMAGIGCVETPGTVTELLLDPGFDLKSGHWVDYREGLPASIVTEDSAETPGNFVRQGPVGASATEQGYADLAQQITIPQNAISLVVSGYYKLMPGTVGDAARDAADDYATLTLFSLADEDDEYIPYVVYHSWYGDDAAQATWKSFTHSTSKATLAKVRDLDVTLDLVTETWDTRFLFDSLSLKVTTCE